MADAGSYGAQSGTASGTTSTTSSNTGGSFPTTTTGEGLGVNGVQVANLSVANFLSDYNISSTEENTYLTDDNGKLSLNDNALMLMQYKAMDASQRQDVQQSLVNAGLLSAAQATGEDLPAGTDAFKSAITTAATTGTDVNTYLQNYSGTNYAENELSGAISNTEKEAAAPTTATVENPTTLAATIQAAFAQADGYPPNEAQIQSFISQMQGQDTANAEAPHQAAEAQLAQLKSDQSQLSKMGPNDIDSIVSAYASAIHGLNPAAGNTANQQGPQNGDLPTTTGPMGATGPSSPATTSTSQVQNAPTGIAGMANAIFNPFAQHIGGTHPVTTTTPGTSSPALTPTSSTPTFGGVYALSPQDWAEAKKLMPNTSLPSTPGAASPAVQETAFRTLLQNRYDNNGGSWADAIVTIAGGGTGDKPVVGSKNLQTFATGIANSVEQQLTTLQNNISTQSVTVKTDQPDATAEASAAAKQADPVGYYASNAASAGSILNQMLSGAPQLYDQSTSDTFTGPVPTAEAVGTPEASVAA